MSRRKRRAARHSTSGRNATATGCRHTGWQPSPQARGKFLAVVGQQAFVAETPEEAWALAKAAHPEDDGAISQYVRPEQGPRIYAHSG